MLLAVCLSAGSASASRPAGTGDGVEVSRDFVHRLMSHYEQNTGQRPTEREKIRSGVEHWLFAREAVVTGLADADADPEKLEPKEVIVLHRMYLAHLMHEELQSVDEDVVLSYYLAYPEKFRIRQPKQNPELPFSGDITEQPGSHVSYEEAKDQIREVLVSSRRSAIRSAGFDELVDKYNVRINY